MSACSFDLRIPRGTTSSVSMLEPESGAIDVRGDGDAAVVKVSRPASPLPKR